MTRRDYIMLSTALRRAMDDARDCVSDAAQNQQLGIESAVREIAHDLAMNNAKFDRMRFLRDAGCQAP